MKKKRSLRYRQRHSCLMTSFILIILVNRKRRRPCRNGFFKIHSLFISFNWMELFQLCRRSWMRRSRRGRRPIWILRRRRDRYLCSRSTTGKYSRGCRSWRGSTGRRWRKWRRCTVRSSRSRRRRRFCNLKSDSSWARTHTWRRGSRSCPSSLLKSR